MKRTIRWFAAPCLTLAILGAFFILWGIAPFGDRFLAWCDMEQQVIPVMLELRSAILGDGSLLYTAQNAGGMNFWGVLFFFAASPFSLLVCAVKEDQMLELMNVLVMVKLTVAAGTASYFFRRRYRFLPTVWNVLLSLSYAFCGFGMLYYQNIIWLDLLILFPLLVCAIHHLVHKDSVYPYILVLTAVVVVQYYLSYTVALYLLLAGALFLLATPDKTKRREAAGRFVFGSVVTLFLSAVVWLPSLVQVFSSGRIGSVMENLLTTNPLNHFPDKLAVLLCTPILFGVLPFLVVKDRRRSRQWLHTKRLYLLLLIPVLLEPVNLMLHTGSYQAFPLRYGYMIVLFGLGLAAELLQPEKSIPLRHPHRLIACLFALAIAFCGLVSWLLTTRLEALESYTHSLWVSSESFWLLLLPCVVGACFCTLLFQLVGSGQASRRVCAVLLAVVTGGQIYLNLSVYLGSAASKDTLYAQTMELNDAVPLDTLTRVKQEKKYCHVNMIGAMGYPTFAHYTSLTRRDVIVAMKKLGYSSYWMELGSNGGTVLSDAILSNRYLIGQSEDFADWMQPVYTGEKLSIAATPFCLPVGTVSDTSPESVSSLDFTDRAGVQSALGAQYLGDASLVTTYPLNNVKKLDYSQQDGLHMVKLERPECYGTMQYSFSVSGRQALYFDLFHTYDSTALREKEYEAVSVRVNGRTVSASYPDAKNNGILSLGTFEDCEVIVTLTVKHDICAASMGVFGVDLDRLQDDLANVEGVEVRQSRRTLTAACEAKKGQYLYLSIPYDDGFTALCNGEERTIYKVNDAFCAIALDEGGNEITLRYLPPGMRVGIAISLVGLVLFAVASPLRRRLRTKATGTLCVGLVFAGAGAVLLVVYVLPVCVSLIGLAL